MTVLLTAFLEHVAPYALAAGAGLVALLGWGFHQRLAGAKAERNKQAAEEAKAKSDADQVDNDVGALPGGLAKERLKKWSRG
ncbi:ABC transporter permease [Mesorhizobium sp. M0050]|uniref:ABC transporter permease n=1 Tax=Mesorhizobium sp. M0050 TaxID=2956861 RepID=UPI003337C752